MSSGAAATSEVERDVLNTVEILGHKAQDAFLQSRLKGKVDFFDPLKRLNLKTLKNIDKVVKVTTIKKQVVQLKQQGYIAFHFLIKSQNLGLQLNLKELMTYPLTPVPYYCYSRWLSYQGWQGQRIQPITKDCSNAALPPIPETLIVLDGNACFYLLKDLPANFGQICSKVFDLLGKTGE